MAESDVPAHPAARTTAAPVTMAARRPFLVVPMWSFRGPASDRRTAATILPPGGRPRGDAGVDRGATAWSAGRGPFLARRSTSVGRIAPEAHEQLGLLLGRLGSVADDERSRCRAGR